MSSSSELPWREEQAIAEHLIQRVCDRGSGRAESECLRNYPRDRYFIGNLRPVAPEETSHLYENENADDETHDPVSDGDDDRDSQAPVESALLTELRQKLAPVAFGADFLVAPEEEESRFTIELNWACYYRIFPTRHQQIAWQNLGRVSIAQADRSTDQQSGAVQQADEIQPSRAFVGTKSRHASTEDMCPRFRKILCAVKGEVLIRQNEDRWQIDRSSLESAIATEIARAEEVAAADDDRFRTKGSLEDSVRVPVDCLRDDASYAAFIALLRTEIPLDWRWQIHVIPRVADTDNEWIIGMQFANRSPVAADLRNRESFFFDTGARFLLTKGTARTFDLAIVPHGFRYDRKVWARGFNCEIRRTGSDVNDWFETTHTPVYTQRRYRTRTDPPATFVNLSKEPLPVLRQVHHAMEAYLEVWHEARDAYQRSQPNWEQNYGREFDSDLEMFKAEIERFVLGLQLIGQDSDVRYAFQLTNETFRRSRGDDAQWRLFQVVFLVTQITSVVALDSKYTVYAPEREKVDIIYFPTGGGKTEAYLGAIIFHCFYDRLRGKRGGVTAWTRFPLRLLTLQQTQRAADVVGLADLVRRHQADERLSGGGVDGFAVGYFVGEGGSPNEITNPANQAYGNPSIVWSQVNDATARQQWKRVVRCPACKSDTVDVDFEPQAVRLVHRCTNSSCEFPNGILPVYVVDNEIYRYLPSLVVGTIDKLAGLGNQRKMAMLFGSVDGRCPEHGYLKLKCCQKDCTAKKTWQFDVGREVSGVTLFVQDELHLLKEGLGTFDSHYETFAQRLRREFGHHDTLKVIASSATIEAFERQVQHLYGRKTQDARCFPGQGPTLAESFYADTLEYPQRLFVGIIPHNKTILNSILELIEYYHREALGIEQAVAGTPNPYGGSLQPGSAQYPLLADLYRTSLTYFLGNRQLNEVRTDIDGDISGNMRADGLPELNVLEMTGNVSTDEVARNLAHLERPAQHGRPPDAVLATNMVSHGVDLDRLNAMLFYGMPRLNAEYIQASSRVGRSHIGIIFNCFHPVRERDQSHYAYFDKFHEFLGQLVEPVAINRWSRFSVQRTVPGLFMGVLLQIIANRLKQGDPNRYYMRNYVLQQVISKSLSADEFSTILQEAYQIQDTSDPALAVFATEIAQHVDAFLYDQIAGSAATANFVSEVLNPAPMRSLRNVDEPVEIELDSYGTEWANRTS